VTHLAWGQLGDRAVIATASWDGTARIWDPATGETLHTLTGHSLKVNYLAWGQLGDRPVIATASDDGTARIWELVTEQFAPRLPGYRSDDLADVDRLDRDREAAALAEVVTSRSASPPLAIGLFGDWGGGKSHFMGRIRENVDRLSRDAGSDDPLTYGAVRQVQFNAWHYAETDLWASLVTELFAQLAVDTNDPGAAQRSHSRLAADLVGRRRLRERLDAARDRRDTLERKLVSARRAPGWDDLPTGVRTDLQKATGPRAEALYRDFAGAGRRVADLVRIAGRLTGTVLRSWRFWLSLLLAAAAGLGWLLVPRLLTATAARLIALSLPALGGLAALFRALSDGWAELREPLNRIRMLARQLSQAQTRDLQTARDVADGEVTALESEITNLTAAGQLAGLVATRARDGTYRSQLGLMTEIRNDFVRMADLLVPASDGAPDAASDPDAAGDRLPNIERIVLYIDDLDRCPPERVVQVLEAIHLLLAVRLFVVVVAVDPRWLLRSLSVHYRDLLEAPGSRTAAGTSPPDAAGPPDGRQSGRHAPVGLDEPDDQIWTSTPAQYLEKIFQLPLTLPPLEQAGYEAMVEILVGPVAPSTAVGSQAVAGPRAEPPVPPAPAVVVSGDGDPAPPAPLAPQPEGVVRLPAARTIPRSDPMQLTNHELQFLKLLGPPFITTPRSVKRLTNSYGFLTAIRGDQRAADLEARTGSSGARDGSYPYRASMTLLATLIGFPAESAVLFVHLHHVARSEPTATWSRFVDDLEPRPHGSCRWANDCIADLDHGSARSWLALVDGLRRLHQQAEDGQLDLPMPLTAWDEWVVPVGRLSFQTGHIVTALDRQPDLALRGDEPPGRHGRGGHRGDGRP